MMTVGLAGIADNLKKMKEQFKNCPICEKEYHYPEYGDGPSGAVQIMISGYYGSRHNYGSRTAFVCDDCADIVLALLKIFDMNGDWAFHVWPERNLGVFPERQKLLELRQRLIHALNISKNMSQ